MTPSQEYVLVKSTYYVRNNPIICYGIALSEKEEDQDVIIQTINNISADKNLVLCLVEQCNLLLPSEDQMWDIIEDFIG